MKYNVISEMSTFHACIKDILNAVNDLRIAADVKDIRMFLPERKPRSVDQKK
jgi:hypothetical protein